jgi:hypothetical protein
VTLIEITAGERAGWQRNAVRELASILETHRDLPVIAWTVAAAGATLVGHVSGPGSAGQARQVFQLWRAALALAEHNETIAAAGTTYLHAAAERVRLTGTVHDDHAGGVRM